MAKEDFRHESLQDARSIGKYLSEVTAGLESGELSFENEEGEIVLRPSGLLGLELRVKRRGAYCTMQLKLSWKEDPIRSAGGALKVRSGNDSKDA